MDLEFSSVWLLRIRINIYENLSAILEAYIAVAYICSMDFTQEWPGLRLASGRYGRGTLRFLARRRSIRIQRMCSRALALSRSRSQAAAQAIIIAHTAIAITARIS